MTVKLNGENFSFEKNLNVTELLTAAKAEQPDYVTVQINGEFIRREDFNKIFINDGDEIEFLYFMGGGRLG